MRLLKPFCLMAQQYELDGRKGTVVCMFQISIKIRPKKISLISSQGVLVFSFLSPTLHNECFSPALLQTSVMKLRKIWTQVACSVPLFHHCQLQYIICYNHNYYNLFYYIFQIRRSLRYRRDPCNKKTVIKSPNTKSNRLLRCYTF